MLINGRATAVALMVTVAAALTACAPQDETAPGGAAGAAASAGSASAGGDCAKDKLATRTPGKLTFGTDNPVYPPWFDDNKPENGKGFEGAVAAALATRLGYATGETAWVRVPFNNAIAPGPKDFDIDINEFSITD